MPGTRSVFAGDYLRARSTFRNAINRCVNMGAQQNSIFQKRSVFRSHLMDFRTSSMDVRPGTAMPATDSANHRAVR